MQFVRRVVLVFVLFFFARFYLFSFVKNGPHYGVSETILFILVQGSDIESEDGGALGKCNF